jgi:uncharacterized repeat protein (TIGR01451 family)
MKWFLGIALVLLAALLLEAGLLAYAMYVLLGVLLVSRFLARNSLANLSAARSWRPVDRNARRAPEPDAAPTAEIGERITVQVIVKNNGRMAAPWVLLEDMLPREALDRRFPQLKVKGKRLQIGLLRGGAEMVLKYTLECLQRGYFQIGPLVLEGGDLFGLHRRFQVKTEPIFLLVYPRLVELEGYDLTSRRPIGEVRMTHRLYEDPTRIAGVRPYEAGDPLNRVHWRATARTGELHCKIYEPSTLAGVTILLDFHVAGYHTRGEPYRSDLAVTTAASLANAVAVMGQQIGLVTNARDAADRIRTDGWTTDQRTRQEARGTAAMRETNDRVQPLRVETRRGVEQLERIRALLARVELTDGFTLAQMVVESAGRIPRDATVVAVLPDVSVESAVALGSLRRQGLAVTVVLITLSENALEEAYGRLVAEGLRDVRHLADETLLPALCRQQVENAAPYQFS